MFRVHDSSGRCRARDFLYAEDAGSFVAFLGDGATIRKGRRILWTEGDPCQQYPQVGEDGTILAPTWGDGYASESYDAVAAQCHVMA